MNEYLLPFQKSLIERVGLALDEVQIGGTSQGILLVGPSGAGKTRAVDFVVSRYAIQGSAGNFETPVVRCEVGAGASSSSMSTDAMRQLGRPLRSREDRSNHKAILWDALRVQKTKIFVAEEAQHALLSGKSEFRKESRDYFKSLWNFSPDMTAAGWTMNSADTTQHKLVVILSGTEELWEVFRSDEEMQSRFGVPIFAPSLGGFTEANIREFREVLRAMVSKLDLGALISPNDDTLVPQLMLCTSGHLRLLWQGLVRVQRYLSRGAVAEPRTHIEKAFLEAGRSGTVIDSPFDMGPEDLVKSMTQARGEHKRTQSPARPRSKRHE